jgi:hypothetical protein
MSPCNGKTIVLVALTLMLLGWGHGRTPGTEKPAAKPARRSKAPKPPFTREQLQKALESRVEFPGIDDDRTTLVEALDRIARLYKVPFDVNEKWFQVDGVLDVLKTEVANPNPIPAMKAPLREVIQKILRRIAAPSGATYLVRKETIEITTRTAVRLELGLPAEEAWDSVRDPDGLALLLPPSPLVVVRFEGTPLPEALDKIAESADLNVVLDPRVKDADKLKIRVRLCNVPAETALRVLADMAGLRVAHLPGVLYVTHPRNAERIWKEEKRRRPLAAPRRLPGERRSPHP